MDTFKNKQKGADVDEGAKQGWADTETKESPTTYKDVLKDMAEGSSLHGIGKVVSSRQLAVKVLWMLLLIATMVLFGMQLRELFTTFYSNPVQTTVSLSFSPLKYPAITFCNMNAIKKSQLFRSEAISRIFNEGPPESRRKRDGRSGYDTLTEVDHDRAINVETLAEPTGRPDYGQQLEAIVDKFKGDREEHKIRPIKSDFEKPGNSLHDDASARRPEDNIRSRRQVSEETTTNEDETTTNGEETTTNGDETTTNGEETTTNGGETTTNEDETTTNREETTTNGDETTTNGEETTTNGEETITNEDETTTNREETAEETTTHAEETTTHAEETTTNGEETTTNGDETTTNGEETTTNGEETITNGEETATNEDETAEETTTHAEETTTNGEQTTFGGIFGTENGVLNEEAEAFYNGQLYSAKDEWEMTISEFRIQYRNETRRKRIESGHLRETFIHQATYAGVLQNTSSEQLFKTFTTTDYGNCYTMDSSSYVAWLSGPSYGLKVTLNLEIEEYIENFASGYGVQLVIHTPGTYPLPVNEGITLSAGTETKLGLRMVQVQRLGAPYGECTDGEDFEQTYGFKYTSAACFELCRTRAIIDRCECIPPNGPDLELNTTAMRVCKYGSLTNLEAIEDTKCILMVDFKLKSSSSTDCKCISPCRDQFYETTISSRIWPKPDYLKTYILSEVCKHTSAPKNDLCDSSDEGEAEQRRYNFLSFIIYFKDLNYENIVEEPVYSGVRFLSDIGGAMGLFMGASVLTYVELLQLLLETLLFCRTKFRTNQQNRVTNIC